MALMNEDEAVSREMIERFAGCAQCYLVIISFLILCRMLIDNVLEFSKMSKRETWKKILDSEEDKKKIADIFMRIDEHTKNFMCVHLYISTNQDFDAMFSSSNSC